MKGELAGPVLRCMVCGDDGGFGILQDLCERCFDRWGGVTE